MQAVLLTFGTAGAMFALYHFGILRATNTFKKVVITATAAVMFFYLISIVLRLFGIQMPLLMEDCQIQQLLAFHLLLPVDFEWK